MPRCPVCQTRYVKDKTQYCSLCGWNLNPYSLVVGVLPEVFLKEKDRVDWAKGLWATVKPNRDLIAQLQLKLSEATASQTASQTANQTQLEAAQQAFNQQSLALSQAKAELLQSQQRIEQLQTQLQQLQQEQAELLAMYHQQGVELAQLREADPNAQASLPAQVSLSAVTRLVNATTPEPAIVESFQPNPTRTWVEHRPEVASPAPVLQSLSFTVITLDEQGEIQTRETGSAAYFVEPLETEPLEMMAIPAGEFHRGSSEDEIERENHESPQQRVTIAAFYLSRFPITQAQWRIVAGWPTVQRSLDPDPSTFKGDNHPVEQICWLDAVEFCARLAQATARSYRLPSEAEWEYACRAGTITPFHTGASITTDLANFDGNYSYAAAPEGRYHQRTVPVGSFQTTNAFGLSGMHGNVWEWCTDVWHDNYQDAPTNQTAWEQGGDPNQRLLRGGAWYCLPGLCRSAQRHWGNVDHSGSGIGFRVACSS